MASCIMCLSDANTNNPSNNEAADNVHAYGYPEQLQADGALPQDTHSLGIHEIHGQPEPTGSSESTQPVIRP